MDSETVPPRTVPSGTAAALPSGRLGRASHAVLAFDVGGTDLKAGLVDSDGSLKGRRRTATPHDPSRPAESILDRVAELAAELAHEYPGSPPRAAGVVVPGIVDAVAGVGVFSVNLGWHDFPFVAEAEARLGMPVSFGHDVGAAGDAEVLLGAARDYRDVVVMVLGTGIAGAVFSEGQAVTAGGHAGELGYALVPSPDGTGTTILEAVGSAGAIARRYTEHSGHAVGGAREVLALSRSGDASAAKVWSEAVDALAFSICQCVSILGTEAVVVGGGLAEAGEAVLGPLRRRVDQLLDFQRRPVILPAQLGQDAGLLGAAIRARALLGSP
ncbi:ROK family protein [Arthrobacter sp. ISL-30]|uniref:ROK family protein n=1 Tax=Arthrobacter sp. ISL-30 TaxID=2819109 RepID=UPI001BEBE03B|nr:ROK family protein [Arthrobacter sp. ISL-30]MBT2513207.1 ROK family protein [Arthrobacter sp. ISL-30]